jgi:hypothetical protein
VRGGDCVWVVGGADSGIAEDVTSCVSGGRRFVFNRQPFYVRVTVQHELCV